MSWSGFKKNVGRATTQVMMKTGHVEKTSDREYEVEERRYRTLESATLRLQKESKGYLDSLRAMTASQMRIAETIDAFYGESGAKDGVSRSYKQAVEDLDAETVKALDGPYRCVTNNPEIQRIAASVIENKKERDATLQEIEAELNWQAGNRKTFTRDFTSDDLEGAAQIIETVYRTTVLEPISRFCAYFPDINECIKKRNHKMLDYDAMRSKVKKLTEKPDKDPSKLPRAEKETEMVNITDPIPLRDKFPFSTLFRSISTRMKEGYKYKGEKSSSEKHNPENFGEETADQSAGEEIERARHAPNKMRRLSSIHGPAKDLPHTLSALPEVNGGIGEKNVGIKRTPNKPRQNIKGSPDPMLLESNDGITVKDSGIKRTPSVLRRLSNLSRLAKDSPDPTLPELKEDDTAKNVGIKRTPNKLHRHTRDVSNTAPLNRIEAVAMESAGIKRTLSMSRLLDSPHGGSKDVPDTASDAAPASSAVHKSPTPKPSFGPHPVLKITKGMPITMHPAFIAAQSKPPTAVHPAFRAAADEPHAQESGRPSDKIGGNNPITRHSRAKSDAHILNMKRATPFFNPSELEAIMSPVKAMFMERQTNLLIQAKAVYDQLNEQLTSELPQLIDLRVPYLDPSFEALVKIQLRFCAEAYSRMAQVQQYLDASTRDQYASGDLDARVEDVLGQIRELSIAGTV